MKNKVSDEKRQILMTWPKGIVIVLCLLGAYAPFYFYFLVPSAMVWLTLTGVVFLIPLIIFSLEALFRLRWKLISVFAVVWLLLCVPFITSEGPQEWLRVLGFYVKTRLVHDYRSRCRLTDFDENGVKQTAGFCEGFDRGEYFDFVVYDTTGEFMLPVSQRTSNWKQVMSAATVKAVVSKEHCAYHLFGNYYAVYVGILELEG